MSQPVPLEFVPGINRESTEYGNKGGWFDCNLVRFRGKHPENMGGWQRFSNRAMTGTPRSLFAWATLAGSQHYAVGTHLKYYIFRGGDPIDITPVRRSLTLGNNPITTGAVNTGVLTINDPGHGITLNSFVTLSGATAVDGIAASLINTEHQVTAVVDANNYQVTTAGSATIGGVSGGGAAVVATYQINVGLDTTVFGTGWGTDPWGAGGWGDPSTSLTETDRLRLWTQDNFGEDLLLNPRDGGIYFKDMSASITDRAVNLTTLTGASDTPVVCRQIAVSDNDRHVLAFGCNPFTSTAQDPLLIRWSDAEDLTNWTVATDTTAGSLRIERGSEIVAAVETDREILTFTDVSLHSVRYVGPPFIFGQQRVGSNIKLISPNAAVSDGSVTYWMDQGRFMIYDGRARELPCTIKDYVFRNVNLTQRFKITAGVNSEFSEIIWNMPFQGSSENNFYVVYNYKYQVWYYGFWDRTAWLDLQFTLPLATSPDGFIYSHENGQDDGSVTPNVALNCFIRSSPYEIGSGYQFMKIRRVIPDVTFDGSNATSGPPQVTLKFTGKNYPGENVVVTRDSPVQRIVELPVQQFTTVLDDIRLRARQVVYEISSNQLGVKWRDGAPRVDMQPDGRA